MVLKRPASTLLLVACVMAGPARLAAQTPAVPYEPQVGQPGKDVVWVPNPSALVEKMLDLARVTSDDFVIDLGSGDGRNVIAAARRGARAMGVEFNPDLVVLSKRHAEEQGVADKATFVEGDMFEADISKATVLSLFLLTDNLRRLTPKFLDLRPGTRIVVNTFTIPDWEPDERESFQGECTSWCTALLWIVPARVEGSWRLPAGELTLQQRFQVVTGTLAAASQSVPLEQVRLRGDRDLLRRGRRDLRRSGQGRHYRGTRHRRRRQGRFVDGDPRARVTRTASR